MRNVGLHLAVLLTVAAPRMSEAQVLYGSMVGHIKDSSESSAPEGVVIIRNTETNQSREARTNEAGDYSFPTIASGPYELTVSKPGFNSATRTGIAVTINNITRRDMTLQVGSVTESGVV